MAEKNKKEKITLENLAQEMRSGFAGTKNAIEDLAIITKHGFDSVSEQFEKMDERFNRLERDHEDMALRLDNVAYRFELVELKKRVEVLEKKAAV